jgi:hypothetical protein
LTVAANAVKLSLGQRGRTVMATNARKVRLPLLAGALCVLIPAIAAAQGAPRMSNDGKPLLDPRGSIFKCEDGGELFAQFATENAQFVAIVQSGDGPHTLPVRPWTGGEPRITWSDGVRTLVWNPGVQLMWTEGAAHRMCGREMGHRH